MYDEKLGAFILLSPGCPGWVLCGKCRRVPLFASRGWGVLMADV